MKLTLIDLIQITDIKCKICIYHTLYLKTHQLPTHKLRKSHYEFQLVNLKYICIGSQVLLEYDFVHISFFLSQYSLCSFLLSITMRRFVINSLEHGQQLYCIFRVATLYLSIRLNTSLSHKSIFWWMYPTSPCIHDRQLSRSYTTTHLLFYWFCKFHVEIFSKVP